MPQSVKDAYVFCPRCGKPFTKRSDVMSACKECGLDLYHAPKPCVGILLVGRYEKLLMVRRGRDPHKGTWDVPGGFCERNESISEAAIREAREELHVEIKVDDIFDSLPEMYTYNEIDYPILATFVSAHIISGTPSPDDDIDHMDYFSPEDAAHLPFGFPSLQKGIQMYIDSINTSTK